MKVHHIQTGSMCPWGGPLMHDKGIFGGHAHLICHSLLVETDDGLVLVDTGFGLEDVRNPRQRLGMLFPTLAGVQLDERMTAVRQVEALGFSRHDVRHILPTHLDLDHVGALSDFPHAKVHVYEDEYIAAMSPKTFKEGQRYRSVQWAHGPHWERYSLEGESWFGFPSVRSLAGAGKDEILIVPITGHSRGHSAIAVKAENGWLMHCGDAYMHRGQLDLTNEHCPVGLDIFQSAQCIDNEARVENIQRLRLLKSNHESEIEIFSAHDEDEFNRLKQISAK